MTLIRVRSFVAAGVGRLFEETFDKQILAIGAEFFRPPIPGIDVPGVFTRRNLQII